VISGVLQFIALPTLPKTPIGLLVYLAGLLILWVVISIPTYFAGKVFTEGKSDFGDAMGATLWGALAYLVVYWAVAISLGSVTGPSASVFATILALLVWLAVYRAAFRTSWVRAVGIVIVAWLILVLLDAVLVRTLGVSFPNFFPFAVQSNL
jgi:hypothetical protein